MTNTGNQSVAVDLYKCLRSGKAMVLYPSMPCRKSCRAGEAESKWFFQYWESICGWKIERLLQLKTKSCFNEFKEKFTKF